MLIFLINPAKQMNQAKDSQRKEDFKQIRIAVDIYYNDYNCYPNTLTFGQEWKIGTTIYMKEVPQDPNCGNDGSLCYTYVVDPNAACPQWNILFGRLVTPPLVTLPACLLQTECLPLNYAQSGYNLCDFGGNIDCDVLQAQTLPIINEIIPLSPTPTPTDMQSEIIPTPTQIVPTPTITIPQNGLYYCGCGNNHVTVCNVTHSIPEGIPYYFDSACSNQCGQPC